MNVGKAILCFLQQALGFFNTTNGISDKGQLWKSEKNMHCSVPFVKTDTFNPE